ncbi:hypothetical protein PABG_05543 [Paracoccidioides brasiliensis Pb03]|nr:hypothetical protein PABG_05543 [Paracoccidioides brasiliensis Pb03]
MHLNSTLLCALAMAMPGSSAAPNATNVADVPTAAGRRPIVYVPKCPKKGTVKFSNSVPRGTKFPKTQVDLCYTTGRSSELRLTFTAFDEEHFHFNPEQDTNDDIWEFSVMEAFISYGTEAPQTYLEFEVNPNNVTYQSFIYNPSRVRAEGTPFDHAFISDPIGDGITAKTTLNRNKKTWVSDVKIPLALFNAPEILCGTRWRMNFFRTITSPATFPKQQLGGWNPPDKASFHITPFFGDAAFV